jgi:hypothetical protein
MLSRCPSSSFADLRASTELLLEPFKVGILIVGVQNGRCKVLAVSPDARNDEIKSASLQWSMGEGVTAL